MSEDCDHDWQVAETWHRPVKEQTEDGTYYVKEHIKMSRWLCTCGAQKEVEHK